MRIGGFISLARIALARLLRWMSRGPLWAGIALSLAADLSDPGMPESIWRPREWLPRLWSRAHNPDLTEPPR